MSQLGSNGTVGASFLTEAEAAEKQLEEIREGVDGVGGVVRFWRIIYQDLYTWRYVIE